jgi:type IV secretion system protein VirB10
MTDHTPSMGTAPDLRLRAEPPRVMRLSRRTLAWAGALAGIGVGALLVYGLQSRDGERPEELYNTDGSAPIDAIASGPNSYDEIPKLGPPLPGDLGRPIFKAQGDGVPASGTNADPAEQEREIARGSALFVTISTDRAKPGTDRPGSEDTTAPGLSMLPPGLTAGTDTKDGKQAFLDAPADHRTVSSERLADPASSYVLLAGSVIPAALITGIRSDLPGQVTAQVTAHVYDSLTGRTLLIPQGSRLIGVYDSQVAFGQQRILLVWTRLILPDGRSIVLERLPAADVEGFAGLEDDVDHHWGRLFLAAGLSTLLGVGTELAGNDESDIARAIRDSTQETIGRAGDEIVRRQIEMAPTLKIRAGFPVRVVVNRDIVLEAYGG